MKGCAPQRIIVQLSAKILTPDCLLSSMPPFLAPARPDLQARSVFAVNRRPIIERLDSGFVAVDIYNELSAFLEKCGHKKIPGKRAFYYWIKAQQSGPSVATSPDFQEDQQAASPPAPSPAKPSKERVFDSSVHYDVSDLV